MPVPNLVSLIMTYFLPFCHDSQDYTFYVSPFGSYCVPSYASFNDALSPALPYRIINKGKAHCSPALQFHDRRLFFTFCCGVYPVPPHADLWLNTGTHRRRKQIWSVEVMLCRAKRGGKTVKMISPRVERRLKVCTFRLQNKAFLFQGYIKF